MKRAKQVKLYARKPHPLIGMRRRQKNERFGRRRPYRLKGKWILEPMRDLIAQHGFDLELEITEMLVKEINSEIDHEQQQCFRCV